MNCQRARQSFAELLDPRPSAPPGSEPAAEIDEVREHLSNCPDCQKEYSALSRVLVDLDALPNPEPTAGLRRGFYAMLEEEKNSARSARAAADREHHRNQTRIWRWIVAPLGAGAFLAVGFFAGTRFSAGPGATPISGAEVASRHEMQELRAKVDRLEMMNQLVAASYQEQQPPANERLQTVLTSASADVPTDRIINELITSLALDSSANVRLHALEALYPHADREVVRSAVLASLSRESNPVVQVQMINFLVAARDLQAKPALERMAGNEKANQDVRQAARLALAQL